MAEFGHVGAEEVSAALELVGLPVSDAREQAPSVKIRGRHGGVWVSWRTSETWNEATSRALMEERFDDPLLLRSGQATDTVVHVEPSDDDLRPMWLRLVSSPSAVVPRWGAAA